MPEVTSVLVAGQGVLDVLADGGFDVAPGGSIIPEGGALRVDIGIIKIQFSGPKGSAIADILINTVDPQ